MGVTLGCTNLEQHLNKNPNAIIVNDLPNDTDKDREYIEKVTATRYDKDEQISSIPKCACGDEKLGVNIGLICNSCGTEVTMNASSVRPELWMKAPDRVKGLLVPKFVVMLRDELRVKKTYNGFDYLLNPSFKPPRGADAKTKLFRQLFFDIPRGVNGVIDNIELIIERIGQFKKRPMTSFLHYYLENKENLIVEYLPLPSRNTLLVEDTHVYTYYDRAIDKVSECAFTMAGIGEETKQKSLETRVATALLSLASFAQGKMETNNAGKPGIIRKMLIGSRLSYAIRTIVTSEHAPHDYRCPKLPKSLAVVMYKPFLLGKLVRRGMTLAEATTYISANTYKPTDLLVELLYELVEESKPVMKEITGRDDMYGLCINLTRLTV